MPEVSEINPSSLLRDSYCSGDRLPETRLICIVSSKIAQSCIYLHTLLNRIWRRAVFKVVVPYIYQTRSQMQFILLSISFLLRWHWLTQPPPVREVLAGEMGPVELDFFAVVIQTKKYEATTLYWITLKQWPYILMLLTNHSKHQDGITHTNSDFWKYWINKLKLVEK